MKKKDETVRIGSEIGTDHYLVAVKEHQQGSRTANEGNRKSRKNARKV